MDRARESENSSVNATAIVGLAVYAAIGWVLLPSDKEGTPWLYFFLATLVLLLLLVVYRALLGIHRAKKFDNTKVGVTDIPTIMRSEMNGRGHS